MPFADLLIIFLSEDQYIKSLIFCKWYNRNVHEKLTRTYLAKHQNRTDILEDLLTIVPPRAPVKGLSREAWRKMTLPHFIDSARHYTVLQELLNRLNIEAPIPAEIVGEK